MLFRISKDIFKAAVFYDQLFLQIRRGNPGMEPLLGSGGKASSSRRQVVKIMQNNSSSVLLELLMHKNTLQHCHFSMPAGAHVGYINVTQR